MLTALSKRKRRPVKPKYAAKIYQMKQRLGWSPQILVVQQLVKRGNRYATEKGKQKVISFAKYPGER